MRSEPSRPPAAGVGATSVMWGPWATGMAASDARLNARFARAGLAAIAPALGLRLLSAALASGLSQAGRGVHRLEPAAHVPGADAADLHGIPGSPGCCSAAKAD